ncbi:MAG: M23 family metallopeptidase [Bacteroidales bacterium]|nr:M23 family metallopeptidase [Bacteroidales bacterium]
MSKTNKFHIHWDFSKSELAIIVMAVSVMLFSLFYVLFSYTPLRNIIPGYPTAAAKRQQIQNAIRIDSLERSVLRWEVYSENLRNVIAGKTAVSMESILYSMQHPDDSVEVKATKKVTANADSTLRAKVEEAERFEITSKNVKKMEIEGMHFFEPLSGTLTGSFDNALHPYVEITAPEGSAVRAVLDGSIIYTEWSEALGWCVIVQHEDGIISIYRHLLKLLKNSADNVSAGTVLGLLGGGALTEGCHLQFELWHNGSPIDPVTYINFYSESSEK